MSVTVASIFDFIGRVLRCKTLSGFEVQAFWSESDEIQIRARHPYGSWHAVTVYQCDGVLGRSENGCPVSPSDVAQRLRKSMLDKRPDWRQQTRLNF